MAINYNPLRTPKESMATLPYVTKCSTFDFEIELIVLICRIPGKEVYMPVILT